jgi:arginyl-tRNA synthetase
MQASLVRELSHEVETLFPGLFGQDLGGLTPAFQPTNPEFEGDITLVVFSVVKRTGKNPEEAARLLGEALLASSTLVEAFQVVKGFLNITLSAAYWHREMNALLGQGGTGLSAASNPEKKMQKVLVEYSSPNTNKPLHLGHVRNILLGYSVAELHKAVGKEVARVNVVNDRGVHICKSMLAYQRFGHGESPQSSGMKGDHLVGHYYVVFDTELKKEIKTLVDQGKTAEEAARMAPLMLEVQDMLRKWEANDPEIRALWTEMNTWVYEGFNQTYAMLGVGFEKIYYESETYLLGKQLVQDGLQKGVMTQDADGSVWIDLTADGLDRKLVQRSDGTSVYITQDLGTALLRFREFQFSEMVYVVGNEQDYHFKVLFLILKKLGFDWASGLSHLSYGMVELPDGKMKSREGNVVDADDLIGEMVEAARETTQALGKLENFEGEEAQRLYHMLAMGALKYFILKVDPKKKMLFDPKESIDFQGNTGPFIQYTHARIQSVMRKAGDLTHASMSKSVDFSPEEKPVMRALLAYPTTVASAARNQSPAEVAQFCYDLARAYNHFYHVCPVLKEEDPGKRLFRVFLSEKTGAILKEAMALLGIEVPNRM